MVFGFVPTIAGDFLSVLLRADVTSLQFGVLRKKRNERFNGCAFAELPSASVVEECQLGDRA
jgi:hypothetical protein